MNVPWFRILNLVLDILGVFARRADSDDIAVRANQERDEMKREIARPTD